MFACGPGKWVVKGGRLKGHGKQTDGVVVHVFELAAGPGDNLYENVAVVGPFGDAYEAAAALELTGWRQLDFGEDRAEWEWKLPGQPTWKVELLDVGRQVPSG